MVKVPVAFSNKVRGSSLTSFDGVEFDFFPTPAFTAKKAFELEASIKSFKVPLETAVREVIRPSIKENFEVGGRPSWASLAESTLKNKKTTKVNVESGKLKRVAAQRNIWDISKHTAIIRGGELIGRVPYALFVQAGHSNRGESQFMGITPGAKPDAQKTLQSALLSTPARPYLMIQPEDATKIREIFAAWVDARIAKAWS